MKYRTGSHTKYKIEYHFVWVTKYRYQVLTGDVGISNTRINKTNLRTSRDRDIAWGCE